MKTVWILRGLPASGKSTWAKSKVAESNCSIKRVNKDDLRAMLDSGKHSKGNESFILGLRDAIILQSLADGKSVIVDDTNLHPKHEEKIREIVKGYNSGSYGNAVSKNPAQVKVKYFHILPEEAIIRDLARPSSVGAKVIWFMYHTYIEKKDEKKAQSLLKQDENLQHAIICDLDGTIALMNGRSPYDYDRCDEDLVNDPIANIVTEYAKNNRTVVFLSGRDGRGRDKTWKWLLENYIALPTINYELHMRAPKDNRKDSIIKKELYEAHIKGKYYVDFVLDDRNQVVELWRSLGLTCLQVADGNF